MNEDNKKKLQGFTLAFGMLLMFVSAVLPLFGYFAGDTSRAMLLYPRYTYAAGAIIVFLVRLTEVYRGDNRRVKRLHTMEKVSAVLYCVSAFLCFYNEGSFGPGDWLAFLMAGAVLQIYASFMIEHEEKKK